MAPFDPFQPQPFNVDLMAREIADDAPRHTLMPPHVPYDVPSVVAIERDADIYPPRRNGVLVPRRAM